MKIFALIDDAGEVVLDFPPIFTYNKVLKFMRYDELQNLARISGYKMALVEVSVKFERTGLVTPITGNPDGISRSISL